ncbi:transporter substrate-binding domain-containing protein [Agrobacterium sp. Ap1]|jgi:octopine/nopaline transport system substrate-binding protein|uniref:transporter substrate-binding domain-containing protein n=1 Tax=Rhizobium/Agrobacterium group TaxID=227290 RepID=UPI0011D07803|nr:transporter substrate-binding domain-containing protein [Agrobacterium sp. Ap1]MBO0143116.1 transporter substrate-binding domain-containing protein [Agrobacterium sp. Ap1]
MTIIKTLAAGMFAAMTLATGAFAQEKTEITIATEGAFPPYNLTRPDGTLDGYDVELAHYLCDHMKIKCTIVAQAFDGMIPALNAGKFDAIMAGMSATEKRKEVIDFSMSYGSTGQAFAVLKDSDLSSMPLKDALYSLSSNQEGARKAVEELKPLLKGKIIGVQTASIASRFIDEYLKDTVEKREYKTTEQHDLDLIAGRVDVIMASMGYLKTAVEKPTNSDIEIVGPRFQGGFLGAGSSVGLRKSDTALKAKFDEAITAAKADGTLKTLSMKWFGFDLTPQ